MYWDDENLKWSTEGVRISEDSNYYFIIIYLTEYSCISNHFSTFGLIENGEQVITTETNPGEFDN